MRRFSIINLIVAILLLSTPTIILADGTGENHNATLFKIGRSKDANEIFYEVKTNLDGSLNLEEPIKIYWIKFTKNEKIEPLTKIQQHFAYGLKFLEVTPEKADFQFVSYSKRTLSLRKTVDGNYGVFTEVDEKEVELERVFVQIDGGTFWFPKITRVEVHARIPEAGDAVIEVINP